MQAFNDCFKVWGGCKNRRLRTSDIAIEIARNLNENPRFVQAVLDESDEVITDNPLLLARRSLENLCQRWLAEVSLKVLPDTSTKDQMRVRGELEWLTGMTLKLQYRYKR